MKELLADLKKVYQMLEDEESRFTYLNRLNYLISGDPQFIERILDTYLPDLPKWGEQTIDQYLTKLPRDKQIILFGAGATGRITLSLFQNDPRFFGFCSSTKEKQRTGFLGYPVMSPEELLERKDLSVIISAFYSKKEILQILHDGGYPEELIFTLDEITISVNDQYFGPDFIQYDEEEVFVDDGCYNLGNAVALRGHCKRVKKVYAFEPDPADYQVCVRNKEVYQFPQAEILPCGTWSESTTLHFSGGHTGSSRISETGNVVIPVRAIDDVVDPNERVTFIKMDIEGAELESLKGARKTIVRDRPKLAICIYHKPEDMTEIPLYIKSLVPEYKLYIRHHSNLDIETVLYAVM